METSDTYLQPGRAASVESKVKGSRFLGEVTIVFDRDEAAAVLAATRRRYHDATHHCSAWRTGPGAGEYRVDDDGEPSGSAGAPILRQIDAAGLTNVMVVVTRWFGGTKLGTGGLVRAYGEAARDALAEAGTRAMILRDTVEVEYSFSDTSPAMHTISRYDVEIIETRYAEGTWMRLGVRRSQTGAFESSWIEALGGRGGLTVVRP